MFREKEQFKLQMFFIRSWISVKYNLVMPQRKKMTSPGKKKTKNKNQPDLDKVEPSRGSAVFPE